VLFKSFSSIIIEIFLKFRRISLDKHGFILFVRFLFLGLYWEGNAAAHRLGNTGLTTFPNYLIFFRNLQEKIGLMGWWKLRNSSSDERWKSMLKGMGWNFSAPAASFFHFHLVNTTQIHSLYHRIIIVLKKTWKRKILWTAKRWNGWIIKTYQDGMRNDAETQLSKTWLTASDTNCLIINQMMLNNSHWWVKDKFESKFFSAKQ
jgi:hypothetical protein